MVWERWLFILEFVVMFKIKLFFALAYSIVLWSPKLNGILFQGKAHSFKICMLSHFSHVLTLCDPMDCRLPGSSVHGILQARILEWVALPSSRGSSWPRDRTHISYVSCIGRQVLQLKKKKERKKKEKNLLQFSWLVGNRALTCWLQNLST